MNKQLLMSGCFVVVFPGAAFAAQETGLTSSPLALSLMVLLPVAAVAAWLFQQLSSLKKQYAQLVRQNQVQVDMVDLAPWPLLQIDKHLKIVYANREAREHFAPHPLIGGSFSELLPDEAADPLLQILASDGQVVGADSSSLGAKGASLRLLTIEGVLFGLWCGRPWSEQSVQGSQDLLTQAEDSANRMKSEFIANINHEVRTPMNAIIGYTEMLVNSPIGSREKRFVETIHKSSMALVAIFNDIMELSKIDSGRLQIMTSSIRMETLIREVEALYQDQAVEKGIRLECRQESHLPKSFILDGMRLKQVFQNLVSNAIKFTNEGYVLLLVDGFPAKEKKNCYDLNITVEDTGIGIPKADQQKIFEVFRQREDTIAKRYGGVGLGLTLTSRLVTMMGGRIDLLSTPGEGTKFTLFLTDIPVADPPCEEDGASETSRGDRQIKPMTMLVVDDVDLIKDVFIDFFQDSSHRVLTADTGEEALELARSGHPDIIFMDLNLSGMDGRSVTEKIREEEALADIPVIVMTGEILEEEDYRPLFDGFLQKPFRLELLKDVIGQYGRVDGEEDSASGRSDDGEHTGDEDTFFRSVQAAWNDELDHLLRQAVRSGSLADAAALGAAVGKAGEASQDAVLITFGGDLLKFAAEPNIMGVDRLLAQFSRVVNQKDV